MRRRSRRPSRVRARSPATSPCRASRRRSWCGCASTSPRSSSDTRCVLLPKDYVRLLHDRREGERLLGCRRHAVAGCRQAPLVAGDAGGHRPHRIAHAAAVSKARTPPARCARKSPRLGHGRVPVAGGGGDNAAGAAGIGVITPGDAFLSLGTSGVLFLVTPKFLPNPQGRARLLPLPAGPVAPDEGDAVAPPPASTGP